jgi:O-antigen ligase
MRRLSLLAFVVVFATLPFELPVSEGLHGLLKPIIGDGYLLFFCGTWTAAASLGYLVVNGNSANRNLAQFVFYGSLFLVPGALAIVMSAISSNGDPQLSVQQFVFGYAAPVLACLALMGMEYEKQRRAWLAFYGGWCLFLLVSLVFLWGSWQIAITSSPLFASLSTGQRVFAWRYLFGESWNLYSVYVGNANKESNYILMFLLFSTKLLGTDKLQTSRITRSVYFTFWTLGVFTLVILFSRAAMFLLPVVVYISGFWRTLNKGVKWSLAGILVCVITFGYSSISAVVAYLLTSTYVDDMSGGALGSFGERFDMWNDLWRYLLQHKDKLIYGLGTGGYGLHFHNTAEAGTHNMFLDTLVESGVVGLIFLVLLICWIILQSLGWFGRTTIRSLELSAAFCLICLMFREHSISYLYVTSLGGLCFVVLFYLLSEPWKPDRVIVSSSRLPQWVEE